MPSTDVASIQAGFSHQLHDLTRPGELIDAASSMLTAVFPNDGVVWNHLDLAAGTAVLRGTPVELVAGPTNLLLAAHAADHPIIQSYFRGPVALGTPRRMSDVASHAELLRTGSYVEVLRPLGIHHQLSIMTTREDALTGSGWGMCRTLRDFTDGEVAVALAVQAVLCLLVGVPVAGATPAAQEGAQRAGLTDREHRVLCLVAHGDTATRIGHLLRIAPTTVRKHLEHVYTKLDAHDRLLAVSRAQALGLLEPVAGPDTR